MGVPLLLSGINIYPIKSARGLAQPAWDVDELGLRLDRRWMVVDAAGEFLSQRTCPRLALACPSLGDDGLTVRAPALPELAIPLSPPPGALLPVTVWGALTCGRPVSADADRWFTALLGTPCRLVYMPDEVVRPVDHTSARAGERTSFTDGFPFLLISQGSLDDLNGRLASPLPMNRFRPNLVVSGCAPFAEDGWAGFQIGAVRFRVAKPCARCVLTTVDQETAEKGVEPLRTLATYRRSAEGQVLFGQNLLHAGSGRLEVGMTVDLTEDS